MLSACLSLLPVLVLAHINQYDEGVRMGSLGMGLNYIVTMLYSVMIPKLQGFIGLKVR